MIHYFIYWKNHCFWRKKQPKVSQDQNDISSHKKQVRLVIVLDYLSNPYSINVENFDYFFESLSQSQNGKNKIVLPRASSASVDSPVTMMILIYLRLSVVNLENH